MRSRSQGDKPSSYLSVMQQEGDIQTINTHNFHEIYSWEKKDDFF